MNEAQLLARARAGDLDALSSSEFPAQAEALIPQHLDRLPSASNTGRSLFMKPVGRRTLLQQSARFSAGVALAGVGGRVVLGAHEPQSGVAGPPGS